MNNKRTNYLVVTLTIIITILVYLLKFGQSDFLENSIITAFYSDVISIYGNPISEFLIQYTNPLIISVFILVGAFNIICAFQNRDNKKLSYFFFALGVTTIFLATDSGKANIMNIIKYIKILVFAIIPLISAIVKLILIHKNKPKNIQLFSYISVIVISLMFILNILPFTIDIFWFIIIVIILFIYIHNQDKDITESKLRKILNIVLYNFVLFLLCMGILILILSTFLSTYFNNSEYKDQLSELHNNIATLSNFKNNETLILVKNNNKYGYININGNEMIPCEYDNISNFYEGYSGYYFALGKKDNEYYILSKDNYTIHIKNKKYIQTIDKEISSHLEKRYKEILHKNYNDIEVFSNVLYCFMTQASFSSNIEQLYEGETYTIELKDNDNGQYYINKDFSIYLETFTSEYYENNIHNEQFNLVASNIEKLFKVSVTQFNDGMVTNTAEEYIPEYMGSYIYTFSDGSIKFESLNQKSHGWYTTTGEKINIPIEYEILDVQNNKAFLHKDDIFYILNLTNNSIINVQELIVTNGTYAYKNENDKFVLYDKYSNVVSNEYDEIIPSTYSSTYYTNYLYSK